MRIHMSGRKLRKAAIYSGNGIQILGGSLFASIGKQVSKARNSKEGQAVEGEIRNLGQQLFNRGKKFVTSKATQGLAQLEKTIDKKLNVEKEFQRDPAVTGNGFLGVLSKVREPKFVAGSKAKRNNIKLNL